MAKPSATIWLTKLVLEALIDTVHQPGPPACSQVHIATANNPFSAEPNKNNHRAVSAVSIIREHCPTMPQAFSSHSRAIDAPPQSKERRYADHCHDAR
jgi:hypothetical protein